MTKRSTAIHFGCLATAALFAACSASKPPDATSPSGATVASSGTTTTKETLAQAAKSGNIQVALEILAACGLSDADAFFPFDSSRLEKKDIRPLNAIATCFMTGPMKGHSLRLVGRADPRGPTDYNMTLGQARSDSTQKYLTDKGLGQSSVQSTSRGAMDATGTDEAGWALDRRVDILLGS